MEVVLPIRQGVAHRSAPLIGWHMVAKLSQLEDIYRRRLKLPPTDEDDPLAESYTQLLDWVVLQVEEVDRLKEGSI